MQYTNKKNLVNKFLFYLIFFAILQLLIIFFSTMRGVALPWPRNSYLFEDFHRFTDWLVPFIWSRENNPWFVEGELGVALPPVPYGPLTFMYLKLFPDTFFSKIVSFFIPLCFLVYLNFKKFKKIFQEEIDYKLYFIVYIMGFYPLHFIIDRGNADVIGACFISLIFYVLLMKTNLSAKQEDGMIGFLIFLAISSKPSWGLILLPFIFRNLKYSAIVAFSLACMYAYPIYSWGVSVNDYLKCFDKALELMRGTVHFSNNASVILRYTFLKLHLDIESYHLRIFLLFIASYFVVTTLYIGGLICRIKNNYCYMLFTYHMLIGTCMLNDPSPDYRLVVFLSLIPILIHMVSDNRIQLNSKLFRIDTVVILGAALISWLGIYSKSGFPLSSVMRAILLFYFDIYLIILMARISERINCK